MSFYSKISNINHSRTPVRIGASQENQVWSFMKNNRAIPHTFNPEFFCRIDSVRDCTVFFIFVKMKMCIL